jgi:hypothetical protein
MGFFFNYGGKEVQYVGSRERQGVDGGLVGGRGWYLCAFWVRWAESRWLDTNSNDR